MTSIHGGQVYDFARTQSQSIQKTLDTVLDFSASINPISPHIPWQQLTQNAQVTLKHYPDQQAISLTERLTKKFKIAANQVTLTNGISSAILQLFSQLKPDTTLLITPIYSEYQRGAQAHSTTVMEVPNTSLSPTFKLHAKQAAKLTSNSIVVLVNPCTPQGKYQEVTDFEPLIQQLKAIGCWLWIDESFLPFIGFQHALSFRPQLMQWPKLIILQSLTKYYACPGIRIGALFSHPKTLHTLAWPSWPISVLDDAFLQYALNDPLHDLKTQQFLKHESPLFIHALTRCKLVNYVYPTHANFILVKLHVDANALYNALKPFQILIRDCRSFGLGKKHIRLAIKSKEQNQQLIKTLQKIEPMFHI